MMNVNLIAERRAQRQRSARLVRIAGYTVISLMVAIVLMYAYFTVAVNGVQGEIVEFDAKLSNPEFRSQLERIDYLEKQCKALQPRVDLLETVQKSQRAWVSVLDDLSRCIPANVWLTSVQSRPDPKGRSLVIAGCALSQRGVGDFMLNLKHAEWCGVPTLNFTQTVGSLGREIVNFDVNAPIKKSVGSELR